MVRTVESIVLRELARKIKHLNINWGANFRENFEARRIHNDACPDILLIGEFKEPVPIHLGRLGSLIDRH